MIYVITCQVLLQFNQVSTTSLRLSLWLQIPCSLPTPHICSTFSIGGALGIKLSICGGAFFCRNSRCIKVVGYFCRRAPSWMFDRILDATLSHNLLWLAECLRRSFPSLGLHKGILDSPCFLILLIYTKHKPKDETLD